MKFSLSALLAGVFVFCLAMAWLSAKLIRARKQHTAVIAIERLGGVVGYRHEWDYKADCFSRRPIPGGWLRPVFGDDFFRVADAVIIDEIGCSEAELEPLSELRSITSLGITDSNVTADALAKLSPLYNLRDLSLYGTNVADEDLRHLFTLRQLKNLTLTETNVTKAGTNKLKNHLPTCKIVYGDVWSKN